MNEACGKILIKARVSEPKKSSLALLERLSGRKKVKFN